MQQAPPESVSPEELWLLITQLPRPRKVVDFPRKDPVTGEPVGQVVLQVLSQQDQMAAAIAAEKFARETLKEYGKKGEEGLGYENIYKNQSAIEILYRACLSKQSVDDGSPRSFFPSPKAMREHLSPDELGVLMSMFLHFQSEAGPIVSFMSETEMEAWVKRLAEGGSAFPLASLSSEGLTDLVMLMASRLYSYLMGTSSRGSQQSESSKSDDD